MRRFGSSILTRLAHAERRRDGDHLYAMLDARRDDDAPGIAEAAITSDDTGMTEPPSSNLRVRRFGRQLLWGLNPEEVAAFVDHVADALDTAHRVNIQRARQIRQLEREVEALTARPTSVTPSDVLQEAAPHATHTIGEEVDTDAGATNRIQWLRTATLQELQVLIHDAQARAQATTDAADERAAMILREADGLKSQRQQEAADLVAGATATAEAILMNARQEESALRQEINRVAESRLRMLDDVRGTLDACRAWLETVDPRQQQGPTDGIVVSEHHTNGVSSTTA
jgi:cell division septum initiation protein DivIVA